MKKTTNIIYSAFALFAFAWFALSPTVQAVCRDDCDASLADTYQGENALVGDAGGGGNTAFGAYALQSNYLGEENTAVGVEANGLNDLGWRNTAVGFWALVNNQVTADTAVGYYALKSNTDGYYNTAVGNEALASNTTASENTATGDFSLHSNTTGANNTATGAFALQSNTTASSNTALGYSALGANTTGISNTANGVDALHSNTAGNYNTASGQGALYSATGSDNTACGQNALRSSTTGTFNIALGTNAGISVTSGSNNIHIFHRGLPADTNTIRIGKQGTQTATFIGGISGATVPTGVAVIVDASGHLGTTTSSARFKDNIKPMDKASEAILALNPVTFHYKKELDTDRTPQFGLVAEDVQKVDPDLVVRDAEGKPYTVRYEAVNAMLLNEFLKEHRKVQKLEATIAQQGNDFEAAVVELKGQIQKLTAQLELSKSAPQTVLNNQ